MKLFKNSIVQLTELQHFLGCHQKTAQRHYQKILAYVHKPPYALLVLEDLATYYQLNLQDLEKFEILDYHENT